MPRLIEMRKVPKARLLVEMMAMRVSLWRRELEVVFSIRIEPRMTRGRLK